MNTQAMWPLARELAAGGQPSEKRRAVVLVATRAADLPIYPSRPFTLVAAHTTADALAVVQDGDPDVVAIDWDAPGLDGAAICDAADGRARVLAVAPVSAAPAALRAGCQEILLRPFNTSLVATRLGRMLREIETGDGRRPQRPGGARRAWPALRCPACDAADVVSFEFAGYRQLWFACLECDQTWLGPSPEQP